MHIPISPCAMLPTKSLTLSLFHFSFFCKKHSMWFLHAIFTWGMTIDAHAIHFTAHCLYDYQTNSKTDTRISLHLIGLEPAKTNKLLRSGFCKTKVDTLAMLLILRCVLRYCLRAVVGMTYCSSCCRNAFWYFIFLKSVL